MRRYCLHTLIIFIVTGMTGCSLVPSFPKPPPFPDLWPFNDEPVANNDTSSKPEAEIEQTANEPEPVVESAPVELQPSAETAEVPVVPQLLPTPTPIPTPAGSGGITESVPGAAAYIISPSDGAVVTNPVRVIFGLDRMGVAPVTSTHEATGHHHLLIDTELPPLDRPIPVDDVHRHFSGGQTEVSLNLPLGQHTLQLLLGDHTHTPHRPPIVSRKITIIVQ